MYYRSGRYGYPCIHLRSGVEISVILYEKKNSQFISVRQRNLCVAVAF